MGQDTVTVYRLADNEPRYDWAPHARDLEQLMEHGYLSETETADVILHWKESVDSTYFDIQFDWQEHETKQYLQELVDENICYTTEEPL